MILKTVFWIFISIAFCMGVHCFLIQLNNIYAYKKVKYLGAVENVKYQQIIDELKKCEVQKEQKLIQNDTNDNISLEMNEMKNSLIEIMKNS